MSIHGQGSIEIDEHPNTPSRSTVSMQKVAPQTDVPVHMSGKGRKWVVETYGGSENLKLVNFDLPASDEDLDADSVLVKILATDATYTDSLVIRGNYQPNPPCPCTPG